MILQDTLLELMSRLKRKTIQRDRARMMLRHYLVDTFQWGNNGTMQLRKQVDRYLRGITCKR
jgi:hypothetical protein